jgi:methyltransferase
VLAGAEVLRVWVVRSLGPYWNTRIVLVPGATLVKKGPYRYVRHPNYMVIVLELLSIPILCGAYWTAAVFTGLNLLILRVRIRTEEKALAELCPEYEQPPLPRFLPRL